MFDVTRLLVAAVSGWGKSRVSQTVMARNLPQVEYAVILDYKDEYRGLVKAGLTKHAIAGANEKGLSVEDWRTVLASEEKLVLARHKLSDEEWREVSARAVKAAREMDGDPLIALDEAHALAPQEGTVPPQIETLATTGRGEGALSIWITQRLQKLDKTPVSQSDEQILGAFRNDRDREKPETEYPEDVHKPGGVDLIHELPEELQVDGKDISLRKWTDSEDKTTGSEWVFSDDEGTLERWDTSNWEFKTTHHGPEGNSMNYPWRDE